MGNKIGLCSLPSQLGVERRGALGQYSLSGQKPSSLKKLAGIDGNDSVSKGHWPFDCCCQFSVPGQMAFDENELR